MDSVEEVQIAVAANPNSSMAILEDLWTRSRSTRSTVIENPVCTEIFLKSVYEEALLPKDDQDETWDDDIRGDTNIRESIVRRSDLSSEFLKILVLDPSHYVRRDLANNSILTDEFLKILALDANEDVREAVINNSNSSPESKATATLLGIPAKEA